MESLLLTTLFSVYIIPKKKFVSNKSIHQYIHPSIYPSIHPSIHPYPSPLIICMLRYNFCFNLSSIIIDPSISQSINPSLFVHQVYPFKLNMSQGLIFFLWDLFFLFFLFYYLHMYGYIRIMNDIYTKI